MGHSSVSCAALCPSAPPILADTAATHLAICTPLALLRLAVRRTGSISPAHVSGKHGARIQIMRALAQLAPILRGRRIGMGRLTRVRWALQRRGTDLRLRVGTTAAELPLEVGQACLELVFSVDLGFDKRLEFGYFPVEL